MTKLLGIEFKSAVLNLYYQRNSWIQMTLRKKTNDNSVRYFPSINTSPSEKSHDHKPKTVSNPRKQNKTFPQNNRMVIKDIITAEGFRIVKLVK